MTVAQVRTATDGVTRLYLWCPGCSSFGEQGALHSIPLDGLAPWWEWDGDLIAPTISPSLHIVSGPEGERTVCHSYVRSGRWEYLADSTHHLAGQTVPLPDLPEWLIPPTT